VGRFGYEASGKAMADNAAKGFIKVLVARQGHRALGVHIIGKNACELVMEGALAVANGLTAEQVAGATHAHPSLSEIYAEAFGNALGRAIHARNA